MISFTSWTTTMLDHVMHIVKAGIPSEVIKHVVLAISVVMATFHAIWTWPNKCFKYQCVDSGMASINGYLQMASSNIGAPWPFRPCAVDFGMGTAKNAAIDMPMTGNAVAKSVGNILECDVLNTGEWW